MGAFDRYAFSKLMQTNPALMKEYLSDRQAEFMAERAGTVFGSPESVSMTPYEYPMMEGEEPIQGLMDTKVTPATGLFDKTMPMDRRMLEFNKRAAMSGVPELQRMALNNMQQMSSATMSAPGMTKGFGAARRMIQDANGDQFWVSTATDKVTGEMETVYSPIGHDKPAPEGKVELIDDMGMTSEEKLNWKAREKQIMAQTDADVNFFLGYIPAAEAAEDMVYETELTQNKIMELYGATDYGTTGLAKWISAIPLTGALDWSELKSTISSRLALQKMMMLKAASSTGATGFGALSEKELKLLTDHLGSLEQAQTPEQIKKTLVNIFNYLERSRKRMREAAEDDRSKYLRLHKRFKGDAPLPEKVQRNEQQRQPPGAARSWADLPEN